MQQLPVSPTTAHALNCLMAPELNCDRHELQSDLLALIATAIEHIPPSAYCQASQRALALLAEHCRDLAQPAN